MYCIHIYIYASHSSTEICIHPLISHAASMCIEPGVPSQQSRHFGPPLPTNMFFSWISAFEGAAWGWLLKKTHKSASDYHQIGPNGFCKPWKINSSLFSTPSQNAMPLLSCCPCRISSAVVLLGHILGFAIDRQRIRILKYLTKIDPI